MQMSPLEPEKANQFQWQALEDQARGFTYCLIDRVGQTIGTAIAIRLGKRFFFATARHVIENSHDIEVLPHGKIANTVSDFAGRHYDEQLDIGLLELTPDKAHRFEFANDAQLFITIDTNIDLRRLVIGYPSQFVRPIEARLTDECSLRILPPVALIYRSVELPLLEWPDSSSLEEPLVAGRDLLVAFEPEERVVLRPPGVSLPDASPVDCGKVDPHGLSGGGIWLAQEEDHNGLWIPGIRLIGIQTGWHEPNSRHRGWLRGIRIGAWLSLVRTRYPDLAEED
jgi:hypothetical protein